ncbi:queuosine precursor transporter [Francisella sp. Scap27]|uniref:queuosine precursor transporter n=1 Tax=Francisella sp. Scap27 TaxID=2589986 RepID=UPI0015BC4690|nr:queuosine precursor transporter [Francisella sp. Scap27]QLE78914.1 queuosine precursor transporter [Francisella sp. Scap27]
MQNSEINSKMIMLATLAMLYGVLSICGQVMASKTVVIFGITASGGVFFMASTFPLNSVITQRYGYKIMRSLILVTLVALVIVAALLSLLSNIQVNSSLTEAYREVFGITELRIALASFMSYLLSENTTSFCTSLFKKTKLNLAVQIFFAAVMGILIDSIIFTHLAFVGMFPYGIVLELVLSLIIIKTLVTLLVSIFFGIFIKKDI